mmetsp:Transcript_14129/g.20175  ORF Transcript_14129/g.20175 Transcript_14129/m.20175 type:complete len:264 (-) Transcript_14129:23-814(-)
MTTAHRPTWKAAVGKSQEGGWSAGGAPSAMRSVLDAPSHTKLKTRHDMLDIDHRKEELLKESLRKLQEVESSYETKKRIGLRSIDAKVEEEGRIKLLKATADIDDDELRAKYDDADEEGIDHSGKLSDEERNVDLEESDLDASDTSDDDDDSEEDDSEDEEEALQRELSKIRAEREKAKKEEEEEVVKEERLKMEEAALVGNPLLHTSSLGNDIGSGKLKRRWNDDVVFRNQAKGETNTNKKRFINDTVRNDFHKRFLNKFIR